MIRCVAIARAVGCSNMIVEDTGSPVKEASLEESSVAASESIPASMSGVSALRADTEEPANSVMIFSTAISVCDLVSSASQP